MKRAFSTRIKFLMHLVLLFLLIGLSIELGVHWALAPGSFLLGCIYFLGLSLPGGIWQFFGRSASFFILARKVDQNGFGHGGHEDRKTWDRAGRSGMTIAYGFVGVVAFFVAGMDDFEGEMVRTAAIWCASMWTGISCAFTLFKTGDDPDS